MARIKIDYGIDLGTTNSAICRMEKGEPVIKKTDTLKDTMPSCVAINKKGTLKVGDTAYNEMKNAKRRATKTGRPDSSDSFIEFKRDMGTDKTYPCQNLGRNFTPEELSGEVLKTLKSFVADENFASVVITVPAKFTVNQKTATMQAARIAGFKQCELLQEPIAASMAYGLSSDTKDGQWMVFDFGGGTFDAALLRAEDGIMQVYDTEGDNYLGGKNLDEAIVDKIIVPYLREHYRLDSILADPAKKEVLREAMKTYAEEVKISLSFKTQEDIISNLGELGEDEDGEEIELDITVTQQQLFDVIRPHYQKAVDICRRLLERNNLVGRLDKLILVGGPTYSPLIRQMLREQITTNVDTGIDPMTAVATGAALYASTLEAHVEQDEIKQDVVRLDVGYESTTVETIEWVTVKLLNDPNGELQVELVRADKAWSSGRVAIDTDGNIIEAQLVENRPNSFEILAYDMSGNRLKCFPDEITIVQGSKVGSAVLPYNFAISVWDYEKKVATIKPLTGLEKNRPIPAVGTRNDLHTSEQLRPGQPDDRISIPVYQSEDMFDMNRRLPAMLYEYVANVTINGNEINAFLPPNSPVEVTLKVNRSEMMTMQVYFPTIETTVTKELDTSKKQSIKEAQEFVANELDGVQWKINQLREEGRNVTDLQRQLDLVKDESRDTSDHKRVLQHLKEVMRLTDVLDDESEWNRIEKKMDDLIKETEGDQLKYGDMNTGAMLANLKAAAERVKRDKDAMLAREITTQLRKLDYRLAMIEYYNAWLYQWNRDFYTINWHDRNRARALIDNGLEKLSRHATVGELAPIIDQIIDLVPEKQRPSNSMGLLS